MSVRPLILSVAVLALLTACGGGRAPEPKARPATSTTSPNGEPLPFRAGADDCRGRWRRGSTAPTPMVTA